MKKLLSLIFMLSFACLIYADGGVGVQIGPVAFGLGGSRRGPIVGVGPAPDNGLPFSAVIIPGDCCCNMRCTYSSRDCCNYRERRRVKKVRRNTSKNNQMVTSY